MADQKGLVFSSLSCVHVCVCVCARARVRVYFEALSFLGRGRGTDDFSVVLKKNR